jgi:hypothetical protein
MDDTVDGTLDDYHLYNALYEEYNQRYHDKSYNEEERELFRRCLERPTATLIAKYKTLAATLKTEFGIFQWEKHAWISPGSYGYHYTATDIEEKFKLHNPGQSGFLYDETKVLTLFVADEGVFILLGPDFDVALCVAKTIEDAVKVFRLEIPPEGTIIDYLRPEITTLRSGFYPGFGFLRYDLNYKERAPGSRRRPRY